LPEVLDHKARLITPLANALPPPHRFLPRRELAGEIEWAKNRMISPDDYMGALETEEHEPPIPVESMEGLYRNYERRKERIGALDFEDMLGLAVRMIDDYPAVAERIRDRYLAFTVDEFQDVNPLQAALLDRWLGGREELASSATTTRRSSVTGASPSYLLTFPRAISEGEDRPPRGELPLDAGDPRPGEQLAPLLGLRQGTPATRAAGPEPLTRSFPSETEEVAWVVDRCRTVHEQGVAWEEIAILMRINARTEPYEEAFAGAGIPYQVRTGAFLQRPAARSVLGRLRRQPEARVQDAIERATDALGFDAAVTPDSEEERTRQSDLGRFRSLAEEFAEAHGEEATVGAFVAELPKRFSVEESGAACNS
jgi:DNA helicase-2/ATP-dependent DNA helicase PcrA